MQHILVIDDFASARLYHSSLLRRMGHTVAEAENGRAALELLRKESFDLILLDLLMPELDGAGFLQQLRALPEGRAGIPVIAVTSEKEAKEELGAGMGNIAAVLIKPVTPGELRKQVECALGSSSLPA